MAANHSSAAYLSLCRLHPGRVGWLMGSTHYKRPRHDVPLALDNDAYSNWKNGTEFDAVAWVRFLDKVKASGVEPLWAAVPDAVGNRDLTLNRWEAFAPTARAYGWPLAFVAQDGMTPADVPVCDVVFVGGTTSWKWRSLPMWCANFPRVHVGRVRTTKLQVCERLGAESCDGTGWMRETMQGRPARQLVAWLEGCNKQYEFP